MLWSMPISAHRLRLEHFQPTLRRTAKHLEKTRRDFAEGGERRYEAVGSIPLFRMASEARAETKYSISRFAPSISLEPATMAAENV